jgi:ArsR family transcriptional regulator, zinc-responsive transcriptional repressor
VSGDTKVHRQRPALGPDLLHAAELFKALSSPLRVALVQAMAEPTTVGRLVEAVGSTQPLVSQHLRVLRHYRLVTVTRRGREAFYAVDHHVQRMVADAVSHTHEGP